MLTHHPEQVSIKLFRDTHYILKNAQLIISENDSNIIYFRVAKEIYKATIKSTMDKKELYLTSIFRSSYDQAKKAKNKAEKILLDKLE